MLVLINESYKNAGVFKKLNLYGLAGKTSFKNIYK